MSFPFLPLEPNLSHQLRHSLSSFPPDISEEIGRNSSEPRATVSKGCVIDRNLHCDGEWGFSPTQRFCPRRRGRAAAVCVEGTTSCVLKVGQGSWEFRQRQSHTSTRFSAICAGPHRLRASKATSPAFCNSRESENLRFAGARSPGRLRCGRMFLSPFPRAHSSALTLFAFPALRWALGSACLPGSHETPPSGPFPGLPPSLPYSKK